MPIHRLSTVLPLLQVGVGIAGPHARRRHASLPILRTALLDTGATITAVRPQVIDVLEPAQVGGIEINRPNGLVDYRSTFRLQIALEPDPHRDDWWLHGRWFQLTVVGAAPANPGVDVLIGRDLLSQVLFTWDGPKETFVLSY